MSVTKRPNCGWINDWKEPIVTTTTSSVRPEKPLPQESVRLRSKDQEIESIKRTLYNAIDRLNKLTEK